MPGRVTSAAPSLRRSRGTGRAHVRAFLGFALAVPLAWIGCGKKDHVPERQATAVKVHVVRPTGGVDGRRYSASIRPDVDVELAFKVGGYVEELFQVSGVDGRRRPLQEGDTVRRGTVLARIRADEYHDRVAEARSSLTQADADYERTARMYENHAASKAEYDAAYARATASRARYDQAVQALDDCTLTATMDGTILQRRIEVGTLVNPGSPAFELADTRSVKIVFGVPDVEVVRLEMGAETEITAEAFPGVTFPGRVSRISAAADPSSRVFEVECLIPNPDGRLRTGMIATLEAPGAATSGAAPRLAVPLNAVIRPRNDPEGYAVFVVEDREGKELAVERLVRLGDVLGNEVSVDEGLSAGERVIVTGATLVQDQREVRIVR